MRKLRRLEGRGIRLNRPVAIRVGALALVGVLVLAVYLLVTDRQDSEQGDSKSNGEPSREEPDTASPKDKTLWLTVPKMQHLEYAEIPTGTGTDEKLFHDYAGVHIEHTGWPWENESSVYVTGYRLGYPRAKSWLAFWDLDELERGDEIYLTDSELRKYTYVVYEKSVKKGPSCKARATDTLPGLEPVEGENIITLQTCTLPDFENYLLVRGELKDISEG